MIERIVEIKSPIEFIVVGPWGSRDRILVRSGDAGLDLEGLGAQPPMSGTSRPSRSILNSLIFDGLRRVHVVSSFPVSDARSAKDRRKSVYRFVWRGPVTANQIEAIQDSFQKQMPELHLAIKRGKEADIKWALGPIILRCVRATDFWRRRRKVLAFVGVIYAALGFLALIVAIVGAIIRNPSSFGL